MKALKLLSAAVLVAFAVSAAPAFAEDTHCPQYSCEARSGAWTGWSQETYTLAEAQAMALQECGWQSANPRSCRVVRCVYSPKLNVWGACFDPNAGWHW